MTACIGFTGKAGSGKDTVAGIVADLLRDHYKINDFAFAGNLKYAASVLFGVDVMNFYNNKEGMCPEWGVTYRALLQKLGTDFAREGIDKDFWLKRADISYVELKNTKNPDILLCTDVRFDNEADWVLKRDGMVIEVVRPITGTAREYATHSSESGIDKLKVDHTIINDGTLQELRGKVTSLLMFIDLLD